ncbi:serine/threonine-protein kinase [Tautonia rosea]|uniref:serine/threonine-protein kinase n=1 Tax=Tautonia rosea TaxID=2728037 RepID=UPI00147387F7|nr:serine/threonine-protein kinase [Tautonia rosea]
MSADHHVDSDPIPLSIAARIDRVCDRFEASWKTGSRPRIEDDLTVMDPEGREALLRDLLALELDYRERCGERPTLSEYRQRFPHEEAIVETVFRASVEHPPGPNTEAECEGEGEETCTFDYPSNASQDEQGLPRLSSGRFGDYELIAMLGRGGMGVVYKARHLRLNRLVALKMLRSGAVATPAEQQRFRAEAETVAGLDHPHIVPIFEAGDVAGLPYFAMKYIEGQSLSARISRYQGDPVSTARLLATVARAVDAAHRQGFLHRDLKPANILIDAKGKPYVTDFGLARRLDEEATALTGSGAVLGTPSYMAPEQAAGSRQAVAEAADIYSLGAILYELLTGRPPFRAKTVLETLVQVLERDPIPPRRIRPEVSQDLEQICLKCLEKEPRRRYATAEELARDLDCVIRGEVVESRDLGPWLRLRRWSRREPKLAFGLLGLAAISALFGIDAWRTADQTSSEVMWVMLIMIVWAAAKLIFQRLSRIESLAYLAPPAWIVTDVILFTTVIGLVDGVSSSLVIGYPLLIALSGLWSRVSLVWLATSLAMGGYGILALSQSSSLATENHSPGIILTALIVVGVAVAHLVRRLNAFIFFYEKYVPDEAP